jgi:hypothetical protein
VRGSASPESESVTTPPSTGTAEEESAEENEESTPCVLDSSRER